MKMIRKKPVGWFTRRGDQDEKISLEVLFNRDLFVVWEITLVPVRESRDFLFVKIACSLIDISSAVVAAS